MSKLRFEYEWLSAGLDDPAFRETTAQLALYVGDTCLARNEDIWSKTVRDSVLVSTYPLAMWFASSWWRLNWEPLQEHGVRPSLDWRMTHEMGAANHGFVWPKALFASDGEFVSIWAEAGAPQVQSVNYLAGVDSPQGIQIGEFQRGVDSFVNAVLSRLRAVGQTDTELEALWGLVIEDRADESVARVRRLEAQLGFDPEECPEDVIAQAISLQSQMGDAAMSELAPIFGKRDEGVALGEIDDLSAIHGIRGRPQVKPANIVMKMAAAPWRRGVDAARQVRAYIDNSAEPIDNKILSHLLGLTEGQIETWSPPSKLHATVAIPIDKEGLNFVSRKRHPVAKRFEFARLLGDYLYEPTNPAHWLASTDLATSRQKYQRAFAAEFLCPIESLVGFLDGDFSESALEDAAERFGVSERTVESLLMNNGYLEDPYLRSGMPYRIAA
jgi:hypothetical protein